MSQPTPSLNDRRAIKKIQEEVLAPADAKLASGGFPAIEWEIDYASFYGKEDAFAGIGPRGVDQIVRGLEAVGKDEFGRQALAAVKKAVIRNIGPDDGDNSVAFDGSAVTLTLKFAAGTYISGDWIGKVIEEKL